MDELYRHLENQIMALVHKYQALQETHTQLEQKQMLVSRENEHLLAKHVRAIMHVENMVSRLKSLET